ncbi:MAG: hypothetical protein RL723_471 [Actinomycetota bacterium]
MQISLRSQYPAKQLGLPGGPLELSWKVLGADTGQSQVAYEIQSAFDLEFTVGLEMIQAKSSDQQFIFAPHVPTESREVSFHRVRIEARDSNGAGGWSDWSPAISHEVGLLNADDFVGSAVGDDSNVDEPATLLRTSFNITKQVANARLYATAHGTYDVLINGQKVGDRILAPGWTPYQFRLLVDTHDVTHFLLEGENAFGALLADGWYRGKLGWENKNNSYGTKTSFLAQIEIEYTDGSTEVIATGENWKTATGGVRFASIYDGCTLDMTQAQVDWCKPGFDDSTWSPVLVREIDKTLLEPLAAAPVRVKAELDMNITQQADLVLLDAGQNISGWVRLKVDGKRGDKVVVRHAEILEPTVKGGQNNRLHVRALRSAKATDTYILGKDGIQELEPKHTFHGFQFADVVTEAKVISAVAVAITTDNQDRSTFKSSHKLLNKFISNVKWSQRDNFVSIPTDCPQRDERMGWTGDAQAFIYAANTLVDSDAFMRSWLKDMTLEQRADGNISIVVPNILDLQNGGPTMFTEHATAGWGDAATVIPWALYQSYGDVQVLRNQLGTMRRWVDYFAGMREGELFPPIMQLGDWLDPDAPVDQPWMAKTSSHFMANAYLAYSAKLLAKAERVVGEPEMASKYQAISDEVNAAIWKELASAAMQTTTGCSILLEFEIAPQSERAQIADQLAAIVQKDGGRISTGFLGTPVILDALSRNGKWQEAYQMLLREKPLSWLFPITMGATTIWERWDAIAADGTISTGKMEDSEAADPDDHSMISFNHYAYGAVLDWIHRNVLGLELSSPGYKAVLVSPKPVQGIDSCKGSIETGYGRLAIDWQLSESGDFHAKLKVPFGVEAQIDLPVRSESVITVNGNQTQNGSNLQHGDYQLSVSDAQVITL